MECQGEKWIKKIHFVIAINLVFYIMGVQSIGWRDNMRILTIRMIVAIKERRYNIIIEYQGLTLKAQQLQSELIVLKEKHKKLLTR